MTAVVKNTVITTFIASKFIITFDVRKSLIQIKH